MDEDRLKRHDLSDAEWARLEPLLPGHPRQGHRWNDHRLVIDGIFFRTRTGCPWRDLPERFGNWKTVYNRHRRWSGDGTWEMILDRLRAGCDEARGQGVDGRRPMPRWCGRTSTRPGRGARRPPMWTRRGWRGGAERPGAPQGLSRITRTGRRWAGPGAG